MSPPFIVETPLSFLSLRRRHFFSWRDFSIERGESNLYSIVVEDSFQRRTSLIEEGPIEGLPRLLKPLKDLALSLFSGSERL